MNWPNKKEPVVIATGSFLFLKPYFLTMQASTR